MRERQLVGLDYLGAVTTLLQRARSAHPTSGSYEAAELQWWWRSPRRSDSLPQLFWYDGAGHPAAAVIVIDWGDRTSLVPIAVPDSSDDRVAHVVERGLAHAAASGYTAVELEVDPADVALRTALLGRGFEIKEQAFLAETWLAADDRPEIGPLPDGYRLLRRVDVASRPHHMLSRRRNHPDVEQRLRQTSLYRPDLDLVVYDGDDEVAAYGLFWFDPETATGLVEPMRTEDEHQRRGLARHVLTTGIDLLARASAARIKICYEVGNPPARDLYLSVGFEPVRQTDLFAGPTS